MIDWIILMKVLMWTVHHQEKIQILVHLLKNAYFHFDLNKILLLLILRMEATTEALCHHCRKPFDLTQKKCDLSNQPAGSEWKQEQAGCECYYFLQNEEISLKRGARKCPQLGEIAADSFKALQNRHWQRVTNLAQVPQNILLLFPDS